MRATCRTPSGASFGRSAVALALLLVAASPGAAIACDSLSIRSLGRQDWTGSAGAGYEVFNSSQLVQTVSFEIRKRGAAGCDWFVTASPGNSGTFNRELQDGANVLTHNLYTASTPANVLEDLSMGNPNVVSGTIVTAGTVTFPVEFYWSIDPSQVVDTATYQDDLTISAYQGTPAMPTLEDTSSVRFQSPVDDTTHLSLVATGGGFDPADAQETLDFGDLVQGEILSFDLLVRTNTGYDISMSSDNRGVLGKITPSDDGSEVPYILRLDSAVIDLSGNKATITGPIGATTAAGNRHVVDVEIGALGTATAGGYQDNVNITVSSK